MSEVFSRLAEYMDSASRGAAVAGLVFAEVRAVTDEGYELEFLSGTFDAPSAPARVATMMAGSRRGSYFMPEVGDEVVVGFELGDFNRPVILGALWSDRDQPPDNVDQSASNNIRTIVSRAGHEVTFDDSPSGKVTIKSRGGMEIVLEDTKITIKTTGNINTSRLELDGVAWNHMHPTGTGPTQGPISIVPVT